MADTRSEIADILRGRILRGLHGGTLRRGERLPSARDLRKEFVVDHRIILDAYRELEREGMVELRPRGGIYVSTAASAGPMALPSVPWIADLLAQAISREIPLQEVHEWLRLAVQTQRLHALAIQSTDDTIEGLVRELRDDYGFEASGLHVNAVQDVEFLPREFTAADLVITTPALEAMVRPLAARHDKTLIIAEIRADLIGGEWRLLLKRPVYVVASDEGFVELLGRYFADVPGRENIRPLILGRDSLDAIPDGAPVYVTRSARVATAGQRIRGRLLPTARLFSPRTSREIVTFMVVANLRALTAR